MIKRLLQVALYQQPHLMCAVLYLTSELIKARGKDAKLLEKVLENCNKPIFKEDNEENDLDDDFKVDIDTSDDENEIVFLGAAMVQSLCPVIDLTNPIIDLMN